MTQTTTPKPLLSGVPDELVEPSLARTAVAGVPRMSGVSGPPVSADDLVDGPWLDAMLASVDESGLRLTGEGGFLPALIKAVLERGLRAELADHLGYDKGDPAGRGAPNSRNGSTPKTLSTEAGEVALATPRDRDGSFEPRLVPKGARRLAGGLDEQIISLYAGGMTVRDIGDHFERTLGVELSHETVSNITDAVLEEVKDWQTRPLDEVYPIVYIDALVVKVRDAGHVTNKAAHIVVGVDTDGIKHVLGIWVQSAEGAKFWLTVLTELRNRGVKDVLIACCDGLPGLPDAIETVWPHAVTQTCVVHLLRADLHRGQRRGGLRRADRVRRLGPGQEVPRRGRGLGTSMGPVHPVSGVPTRGPQDHLHHQRDRELELPAPQDHQEPWPLPQRRRRDQAALARDPRHRGQTRPGPRQGEGHPGEQAQGPATPGRGRCGPRLERGPQRFEHRLPRTASRRRRPVMTSRHDNDSIAAPWVLLDAGTLDQTACLLERLAGWLEGPDTPATTNCASALSLDETNDPISISSWAHALAARLRHRADEATIDPAQHTN